MIEAPLDESAFSASPAAEEELLSRSAHDTARLRPPPGSSPFTTLERVLFG